MKVLAYSPSVEAYVAVRKKGGYSYVDITDDIVQCTVSRKCDAASSFSIRLQNVDHKYNGLFEPFDRVTVLATKGSPVRLITGYITTAPKFTTYGSDITIEGLCPLYRLQQTYWDSGLRESLLLVGYEGGETSWDGVLMNLLVKIGGYSSSQVIIGEMPKDVANFAYEMYAANQDSSSYLKSMADEFYEVLRTHGPKFKSSAGSGSGSGGDQSVSGSGGGAFLDGVDFSMSEDKFVQHWGGRIDAWYRNKWSGSPLEGHGSVFAQAAYNAKFEPRFLPAVSGAEQSGGLVESGLNGNYYGWAVYDSGMGELASGGASGIDGWIYYLLSDRALFAGKPLYQQSWDVIAASWASSPAWAGRVMEFMKEI